jgi:hypothetical protein
MGAEVHIDGLSDAIMMALDKRIDAALSTVDEVPYILKEVASLDNEDVDGNQFPKKKPRPPKNPTNNPNFACIDTANMFDNDRFKSEEVSPTARDCVYSPPDYLTFLIEKEPEKGGRKWITPTQINDHAAQKIQEEMVRRFKEAE